MQVNETKVLNLTVDFYEVDAGFILFKFKLGDQTFDSRFSTVFDPIIDFKNWLEAISVGVKQCSFEYDTEGNVIMLDLNRIFWDEEELTVSEAYSDGAIFIKGVVSRKQIVEAFYNGLLSFTTSDKFKSEEWEIEYIYERLSTALNWDKEKQVTELCKLNRIELKEVLFNADPSYNVSFPSLKNQEDRIKFFVNEITTGIKDETIERIKTPSEWQVPDDYNFWEADKKEIYVRECLDHPVDGNRGTKIKDFRSPLIEKFLGEE